jgi:3-phenylpropionate/cinnamic acid dioxygenase small subunit
MTAQARIQLDAQTQYAVEQFLYEEAALLDDRRFHEWLELFTDDIHYWMPLRRTVARGEEQREFTELNDQSYFDDDKATLTQRVDKFDTGFSWSEDPPSRTRHSVTNVRLRSTERGDELLVLCNFTIYRSRLATEEDWWVGRREDTLRKVDGSWKIARRVIYLDQTLLRSKNLSSFF